MLYVITADDAKDIAQRRRAARTAHMKRIEELLADGQLILAGAYPVIDSPDPGPAGVTGEMIVAEFESIEHAQEWIDADPYVTQGVFARVDVRPFLQTLPI